MQAATLENPGRIVVVPEWEEPTAGAGEVLVEIHAVGICGTDLGYWKGLRVPSQYPWVLGHEAAGRIIGVGEGVDPQRIGELVALEPNYPGGHCAPCERNETSLCTDRGSVALNLPGFLAERVSAPAEFAWTLPDDLPLEAAVCTEPLAVVMGAIRRAGEMPTGSRVLVVGAGAQGLLLVHSLKSGGHDVAVQEPNPDRLDRALGLGARLADDDELFPFTFESSGSARGGESTVNRLAPAGTAIFIGVGNDPIPVDSRVLVRRGVRLQGSMIYDHPVDFATTVAAISSRAVRPELTLGKEFTFAETEAAFATSHELPGKTWIRFPASRSTNSSERQPA